MCVMCWSAIMPLAFFISSITPLTDSSTMDGLQSHDPLCQSPQQLSVKLRSAGKSVRPQLTITYNSNYIKGMIQYAFHILQ